MKRLIMMTSLYVASVCPAFAQFDPAKAYQESTAVSQQFPDPPAYPTPAFSEGRVDLTTQDEMMAFLQKRLSSPVFKLDESHKSQQGRILPIVHLSRDHVQMGKGNKPVVLILAQQHGNEPAGGEAALALVDLLSEGRLTPLLDTIDVLIVPRANPDGATRFFRSLANGIDANRDHTLSRTPEIAAISGLFTQYQPQAVLDCHEFTVGGRWIEKLGGLLKMDAMLQYATVPNLSSPVHKISSALVMPALQKALKAQNLTYDWYFTTDGSKKDAPVAMGGIGPDTGRNIAGLRHAASFLIETRGVGLGRAHYARRVHTHVTAAEAVMRSVAEQPAVFLAMSKASRLEASENAAPLIISAKQKAEQRVVTVLEPVSGTEQAVQVQWLSSLTIEPLITRPRPKAYILPAQATEALAVLSRAGITIQRFDKPYSFDAEAYRALRIDSGAKEDGRGDDVGAGAIIKGSYALEPLQITVAAGDVLVPMNQPLSALIATLVEPESSAGLVANRLIEAKEGALLSLFRLPQRP